MDQGDLIEENTPVHLPYIYECRVQADKGTKHLDRPREKSDKPKELNFTVYCYDDPKSQGAPLFKMGKSSSVLLGCLLLISAGRQSPQAGCTESGSEQTQSS